MSGRHPFSELTKDFTPERRRRIDDMKSELLAEMPLHELRRARALTQRGLATTLRVNQPAVAKLEQRADVYVSSLRSYIEAVGGKLKIVAEFPEGEVAITNFAQVGEVEGSSKRARPHMDEAKINEDLGMIGKQAFVTHYTRLANFDLPNKEVADLIASDLHCTFVNAMSFRVRPSRALIQAGQGKTALLIISRSTRLPRRVTQMAYELAMGLRKEQPA